MGTKSILAKSLESISYQMDPSFFRELVGAFTILRESNQRLNGGKNDQKLIKEAKVSAIVKRHTGLNIVMTSGMQDGINAYVYPPHLDNNHPLITTSNRIYYTNKDALTRIKKAKAGIEGSVNLKTGMVSGVYTEIKSRIHVSSHFIQGEHFEVEEAVAIFMHEIGHLVTYYEYLGRSVMLNHVLGDAIKLLTETDSTVERVKIVSETCKTLECDYDPKVILPASGNVEVLREIMISSYVNRSNSATNTQVYDYRSWEALADQYVNRCGAGVHLAKGLDKLMRMVGHHTYRSNIKYLIIESVKVTFAITVFLPTFLICTLLIGFSEIEDTYDQPIERIRRLRADMVNALKQPNVDADYRKRLQEDIDDLDKLTDGLKDRETVIGWIWSHLYGHNRKQLKRLEMVQELESILNNDLFVVANKLQLKSKETTHA